jgi:hypothetical protein
MSQTATTTNGHPDKTPEPSTEDIETAVAAVRRLLEGSDEVRLYRTSGGEVAFRDLPHVSDPVTSSQS